MLNESKDNKKKVNLRKSLFMNYVKVSKGAKIGNRYNQVPHLTQDTNGKMTNSQLDTTNEGQEVISFPEGDHKAHKTDANKGIADTRQKKT